MNLATYWMVVPLIGIGLSGFGWLALWITRPRGPGNHPTAGAPHAN